METIAERFVRNANRRLGAFEKPQFHATPRPNLHKDALNQPSEWEDLLTDPQSLQCQQEVKASLPIPFNPPGANDRLIINNCDPARRIVIEKCKYKNEFEKALRSHKIVRSEIERMSSQLSSNQVKMSSGLHSLVALASEDPHPYFDADYNYLYGNTVTFAELNQNTTILYPDTAGNISAAIPKYTDDFCTPCETHQAKHSMDEEEPILDIDICSRTMLLRQKKSCGLYKVKSRKRFRLKEMCSVSSNNLYIASTLNKFKKLEFAVLSPNFTIAVHDSAGGVTRSWNLPIEEINDHWGHLHYNDENTLMYCNRRFLKLLDTREPTHSGSLVWDIRSCTETCDDIFSSVRGLSLHYVSTKHYLLSLDLRKGWYQRWSHNLSRSPLLLSLVQKQMLNDTLLLGSQDGGIVCVQNSNSEKFDLELAISPPYKLPTPMDTLHRARTLGRCLSPLVSSRFSMSLVGATAYKAFDKVHVFSRNSVGDVFTQTMTPKEDSGPPSFPLVDAELQHLDDWADQCCRKYERSRQSFKAQTVYPCKGYAELFDHPPTSSADDDSVTDSEPQKNISLSSQPWARSKKHLTSCTDVLASTLLAHWKLDDDDDEWCSISDEDQRSNPPTDNSESTDEDEKLDKKVRGWLEHMEGPSTVKPVENKSKKYKKYI